MIDYTLHPIHELPVGAMRAVVQPFADSAKMRWNGPDRVLVQCGNKVYSSGRHYRDIRDESQQCRRAWCRLTGVRHSDLDKARKEQEAAKRAERRDEDVDDLRHTADRLGFDIVERKA